MPGVVLCRLPTQMCEGCSEAFPDEQLDTLYRNDPALYCGACRSEREDKADKARDEDFYGV
jgi:hypothetical protein